MRFLSILMAVMLAGITLQAATTHAQVPPTRFFGIVTINDSLAPAGTEVSAFINDVLCGVTLTAADDGLYVLDASHEVFIEGCGVDDAEVRFTVNGVPANEVSYFTSGFFRNVDLSVTGEAPPLAPPPPSDAPPEDAPPAEAPPEEAPPEEAPPEEAPPEEAPPADAPPEEAPPAEDAPPEDAPHAE